MSSMSPVSTVLTNPWVTTTRRTYTNADALRANLTPCETDPERGVLSRTLDPFHATAVLTVGSLKGNKRHVCEACAKKYHGNQKQAAGVRWE